MTTVKLISEHGKLYTPVSLANEELREHYDGENPILLFFYGGGDVDTINWPDPNLEQLRQAFLDSIETGELPSDTDTNELILPDNTRLNLQTLEITTPPPDNWIHNILQDMSSNPADNKVDPAIDWIENRPTEQPTKQRTELNIHQCSICKLWWADKAEESDCCYD